MPRPQTNFTPHTETPQELTSLLHVEIHRGLSLDEAKKRLKENGSNNLEKTKKFSAVRQIIKQFKSPLVFILLIAGVLTFLLGETLDATVISIALAINVAIGVFQEGRASEAFSKLNKSQVHKATVIRDGRRQIIPAEDLVPGDLVLLEQGVAVPADLRLLEANNLTLNEAALTGESSEVKKNTKVIDEDTPLAERSNMAWRGTLVAGGSGKGIVFATGKETELGKIAGSLSAGEDVETPIQKHIESLAKFLVVVIAVIIAIIFALGLFRGAPILELVLLSVAVAVSVIPEGLPAAVTVVLAIGMEEILKKGGLVKNLLAAETLGSTTYILTDKTGTLTEARMALSDMFTVTDKFNLEEQKRETLSEGSDIDTLVKMAAVTSDAFIEEKEGEMIVNGRPLEKAALEGALSFGINQDELLSIEGRLDYIPFQSKVRFEVSLNKTKGKDDNTVHFSGSPEALLEISDRVLIDGKAEKISSKHKEYFEEILNKEAGRGKRFIAIAYKEVSWDTLPRDEKEEVSKEIKKDAIFVGLLAFSDPIRADVPEQIKRVQEAGARVLMVTGDHQETARFIAEQAGIRGVGRGVLTGADVEKMSDKELLHSLSSVRVYARMVPNAKLRIANLLRQRGEVVAMTGDGVNDAPALQFADIGIAVESGTDVAKESADLILLKDSFSIIVHAIEEGRRIIDNLKKVITHNISTGFGEVFVIVGAMLFGLPLPILPAQILWVNVIGEGILSFAFAFEPAEEGIMKRDPRSLKLKTIMTDEVRKLIMISGTVTGVLSLILFLFLNNYGMAIEEIRTIIFAALSIDAIFFAISIKNLHVPIWKIEVFSNRYLIGTLLLSSVLLIASLTLSPLQNLLSLAIPSMFGLALIALIGVFDIVTIESTKFFVFKRSQ